MNLEEWRKARAEGEVFTLPSGLEVRLRKITALDLVLTGAVPTTLYAVADKYIADTGGIDAEKFREFEPMINAVCEACFVEPRIVDARQEHSGMTTGLLVTEIPIEDRMAVFEWSNSVSGALRKFRGEQAAVVDAA
jgi:hypothetical protein